jgi:hypothetical protein
MKIGFSKNKKMNLHFSTKGMLHGLKRISRFIVFFTFLLTFVFMGLFWYRYLYAFDWTEEQKQGYRNEYAGETTFREEKFDQTIELLKKRDELYQTAPQVSRDVFFGKSL